MHGQPDAQQQDCQLDQQHHGQPAGHRDRRWGDVDGQRRAVGKAQVGLEVGIRAGDVLEGQAVVAADGLDDRLGGHGRVAAGHRLAGQALVETVAVGMPFQARQPGRTFGCRQAVEDGH